MQLRVIAPFTLELSPETALQIDALLLDFGAPNGMPLITNYGLVSKHLDRIAELGFGFSTLTASESAADDDPEVIRRLLADWGWSGDPSQQPRWLPEPDPGRVD